MAMNPTPQNIIRDVKALLETRGLRYAAHPSVAGAANSDSFKVFAPAIGSTLGPGSSATVRIIIDLTTSELNTMGETVYGSDNQIPDPART